ncbi:MAG: hypothetical protein HYX75_24480 [Acidobacteria bacterium]|nr:hypothetical protein [Acidobacteriota bacterium]
MLEISGWLGPNARASEPGGNDSRHVFRSLRNIANTVLPKEPRPSAWEVGYFQPAIHHSPVRDYRPDVTLMITIVDRDDFARPVDACEVRCLAEIQERLRILGACDRQWTRHSGGER